MNIVYYVFVKRNKLNTFDAVNVVTHRHLGDNLPIRDDHDEDVTINIKYTNDAIRRILVPSKFVVFFSFYLQIKLKVENHLPL